MIEIALAVTGLGILHPVPLVGKRAQGLAEYHEAQDLDAGLAGAGNKALTLHPDEITDIELGRNGQRGGVQFLGIKVHLHPSSQIGEVKEAAPAHVPVGRDPARHRDRTSLGKTFPDLGNRATGLESAAERVDPLVTEGLEFLPADGNEVTKR